MMTASVFSTRLTDPRLRTLSSFAGQACLRPRREGLALAARRDEVGGAIFAASLKLASQPEAESVDRYTLAQAREALGRRRYPRRYRKPKAVALVRDLAQEVAGIRATRAAVRGDQSRKTLRDRLDAYRSRLVRRAADACLRSYERQSATRVEVASTFAATAGLLEKTEGWIEYKGRAKPRLGITDAQYTIYVQRGWLLLPEWLRDCDGLLTVGAIRDHESEAEGEEVWRARWVRPTRGDVETVSGYVVRQGQYTAHARTVAAARGVIRKQQPEYLAAQNERERQAAERRDRIRAAIVRRLDEGRLNGYGDVVVTLADSRRAGNCADGTAAWVERHFPGRTEALVREVVEIEDQHERVLLACAAAVRRAGLE